MPSSTVIDCSLRGMVSLLASISKAPGGAVRIATGLPQSALAVALATVLLGATAARALDHWCTLWSRTTVGAAAANDAPWSLR